MHQTCLTTGRLGIVGLRWRTIPFLVSALGYQHLDLYPCELCRIGITTSMSLREGAYIRALTIEQIQVSAPQISAVGGQIKDS